MSTSENSEPSDEDVKVDAKQAGRGGLAIAGAKIYFMIVGLGQQVALKALLGLSGYGAYSTASSVASITYNPVVQTSILGVSRETAGAAGDGPGLLRRLLVVHGLAALGLSLLFLAASGLIAEQLGAPHVAATLRVLSGVILTYGLYAPLVGALNGARRFLGQAALDVIAATLRTAGLIGGAYLGLRLYQANPLAGVEGAATGFTVAAAFILLIALRVAGAGSTGETGFQLKRYWRFVLPLFLGQLLLNVLFQSDALILRRFASVAALAGGGQVEDADPYVGAYRAAQLFSFLPYQLLMSVTFIIFPLLAKAHANQESDAIRRYVMEGTRLAMILAGGMVAVLLALPEGLIHLVYGSDAARLGAPAMRPLAAGLGCFAVLGVMTTALNALGAARLTRNLTLMAVLLVVGLCSTLAQGKALGPALLTAVAQGTAVALLLTTLVTSYFLRSEAGGVVSAKSALRIVLATAGAAVCGHLIFAPGESGPSRLLTLAGALCVGLVYLGLLAAIRELNRNDTDRVLAVLGKTTG